MPERVAASLPSWPRLDDRPAALRERFEQVRAKLAGRDTILEGVAELGRLCHANGYANEAETCWRVLSAERPRDAHWCYYLADLRRTAGDYGETRRLLERTAELAADYAPVWLQLAEMDFKTGQLEAATREYRRRLNLLPGDPNATLGLARVAQQQGRRDEARRLIERIVRDTPGFPPAHNLYAEMLAADGDATAANLQRWLGREAGRFREADDPWRRDLDAWCFDPARLRVLGTIQFQINEGDRGRALIERAVALAPEDPAGYELLGDLYLKLGEPEKARATLADGIQRTRTTRPSAMMFVHLSEAYRALHQPEEALRTARRGLTEAADQHGLHHAMGIVLGDLGRHEEAVAAFRAALAHTPNDADTNFDLAVSLLALGRENEAFDSMQQALQSRPTYPQALILLGRRELDAGRLDAAEAYIRPLYEAHPGQAPARELMVQWELRSGTAADKRKDPADAERHFRAGLRVEPEHAELNASLGVLCLVQGRFKDALTPLETYHRLQPGNPQSSLFLGQVYARLGRIDEARRTLTEGAELAERAGNATTAKFCREILGHL